jgi:hypothetical protein
MRKGGVTGMENGGLSASFERAKNRKKETKASSTTATAATASKNNNKEEIESKNQNTRTVYRLVVYKRGPMLLMLVVDATKMSNQSKLPKAKNSKPSGDGVTSMPTFCRLLHSRYVCFIYLLKILRSTI